jgi:cell division protein FtsB
MSLTIHIERTLDNRDLAERVTHLEAENAALRQRIGFLEAENHGLRQPPIGVLAPGIRLMGATEVTR